MAEQKDDRSAAPQQPVNRFEIFRLQVLLHFLGRHRAHLDAAEQIGRCPLEMALSDAPLLRRGFFSRECDLEIAKSKPAIFWDEPPGDASHQLAKSKKEG